MLSIRVLGVVGGCSALLFGLVLLVSVRLLPAVWHPTRRTRVAFDIINYIHSIFGTIAGVLVLAEGRLGRSAILSRSDPLDLACAVTLGYLAVDCLPVWLDPGILVRPGRDQTYHVFHVLIVIGFLLYLLNGTGGLVAAWGLVSELDTVLINQHEFYDWAVVSGRMQPLPRARVWSLYFEFGVRVLTRGIGFLALSLMCWVDVYTCFMRGCSVSTAAGVVIAMVQIAVVHVGTTINVMWCFEQRRYLPHQVEHIAYQAKLRSAQGHGE